MLAWLPISPMRNGERKTLSRRPRHGLFGRMVQAQGGPADLRHPGGRICHSARHPGDQGAEIGFHRRLSHSGDRLAVIGARRRAPAPEDRIDHRTGYTDILPVGGEVRAGEPMAFVHAADDAPRERREALSSVCGYRRRGRARAGGRRQADQLTSRISLSSAE